MLEDFAKQIQEKVEDEQKEIVETFVDPLSLSIYLSIISSIIYLIKTIYDCRNKRKMAEGIKDEVKEPGLFTRLMIARQTRKQLRRDYRKYGKTVEDKIVETARELSVDQIEKILEDAQIDFT